jgi:hypothetical protein
MLNKLGKAGKCYQDKVKSTGEALPDMQVDGLNLQKAFNKEFA